MAAATLDLARSIQADWERGDFSSAGWAHAEIEYVNVGRPTRAIPEGRQLSRATNKEECMQASHASRPRPTVVNIQDPLFDEPREYEGFRSLRARIGRQAGTERLGPT
jgi:hypothetical protein